MRNKERCMRERREKVVKEDQRRKTKRSNDRIQMRIQG